MNNDPWLERWLPLITQKCANKELLEIGCGRGWDTIVLAEAGLKVQAIDLHDGDQLQNQLLNVRFQQVDVQDFFPQPENRYPVILASLSLHYFPWDITRRLIEDVHHALDQDGLLLFRVNSTEDKLYGAEGYPEISHHFYQVGEQSKRFFDDADLAQLFVTHKWSIMSQENMTIDRFDRLKNVWELILKKG